MSNQNISICIQYVYPNIKEETIREVFEELNLGEISRIDIKNKVDRENKNYNLVFIHFHEWFDNEEANETKDALSKGKEIKIYYTDKWFWKITLARKPREENTTRRRPRIVIEKDEPIEPIEEPVELVVEERKEETINVKGKKKKTNVML
jgi:hypothetical protein